ncbi:HSF-type DNA-binding-domain-containing protein [Hysterangium stoloniferum]|nr:HSF-type DNA-binding-domain-containing protein [Hysterangium stoloniferum]
MDPQRTNYYSPQYSNNIVYPQLLSNPSSDNTQLHVTNDRDTKQPQPHQHQQNDSPKSESKPQATFLTKLYALLERPENHHMIRWDAAGDHIIVEKPEQLALHVLPSIYRQSRFASFSRQLNIYGFMRKVNLRNVDPAIDDPDASTWSHPTLNRHSPPEVVANFKRRVPPRLPKPRKRADEMTSLGPPRSAVGLGSVSLTVPSMPPIRGRARGFSAPGAFNGGQIAPHWNQPYNRTPLPPLTVPSDGGNQYGHPNSHLASPSDETSPHPGYSSGYQSAAPSVRESSMYGGYSNNTGSQSAHWEFPPLNTPSTTSTPHSGPSLSSLLNHPNVPSGGYNSRLSISTSQVQPFNSVSMPTSSSSSLSPDSRPTTGYSGTSSMSSLPYEPPSPSDQHNGRDYDHPDSRPLTPGSLPRPHSANKGNYVGGPGAGGSMGMRRGRRHSQAVSPYPSPYEPDSRPLSAPDGSLPRTKSLMALSSTGDNYYIPPAQAEFAYSPASQEPAHHEAMDASWGPNNNGNNRVRPSTSQSSLSAASHSSSSAANTPPTIDSYQETDIHRCEYR